MNGCVSATVGRFIRGLMLFSSEEFALLSAILS